ncbi:MAG: UDP-2,3-diacylglucosamine diphosphatase LpxI [Proteobacteria bacterium]|nr:UDP-2,3-diacylglucosamine diphosphatase LpxI [Pseudomonadota bacterium]
MRVTDTREPIAIVCGGGSLPLQIAAAAVAQGREAFLLGIVGVASADIERYPHAWIRLGELRRPVALMRARGCRDVCIIGQVTRPRLRSLAFDRGTLRIATRLARLWIGGDNQLLSGLARIFEADFGLRIVGAHEVAPELLVPEGALTTCRPDARAGDDIALGLAVIHALGPHDVGQAVVVAQGRVLAIEAAEGTDAMIARVAKLRRDGVVAMAPGVGTLVKAPKPSQDDRLDLPTIGPRTVEGAADAGLAGIAVASGKTLCANVDLAVAAADAARIFIYGIAPKPQA